MNSLCDRPALCFSTQEGCLREFDAFRGGYDMEKNDFKKSVLPEKF